MKILIGLGNPGEKYQETRHNIGFMTVDTLLKQFEPLKKTFWERDEKIDTKILKIEGEEILLAKPKTFMNNSGFAVKTLLSKNKTNPEDLVLIYDDVDLPLGKIRIRFGGAAGGHHGVESVIEQLGSDKFLRVRLGIGDTKLNNFKKQKRDITEYVVSPFTAQERKKAKEMIDQAIRSIGLIIEHGIDKYMSKYNNKNLVSNKKETMKANNS